MDSFWSEIIKLTLIIFIGSVLGIIAYYIGRIIKELKQDE